MGVSLSPSARPSRTNGGTRVLRNRNVVPWTRIRKRGVERRNPCENDLTSPRRGGRGAWPITDGRAERQSHPLRSRVRENPIASEEGKGRDPYLLALFFVPSFDEGRKISKRVELEFLEFFRKDGEERKCRLSPPLKSFLRGCCAIGG